MEPSAFESGVLLVGEREFAVGGRPEGRGRDTRTPLPHENKRLPGDVSDTKSQTKPPACYAIGRTGGFQGCYPVR